MFFIKIAQYIITWRPSRRSLLTRPASLKVKRNHKPNEWDRNQTKNRFWNFKAAEKQQQQNNNKQINSTVGMTNGELTKMCLLKDNNLNYATNCRISERNVCEVWLKDELQKWSSRLLDNLSNCLIFAPEKFSDCLASVRIISAIHLSTTLHKHAFLSLIIPFTRAQQILLTCSHLSGFIAHLLRSS